MAANGISTLATKEARQIAKLEYAQAKRKGRVITDDPGGTPDAYGTWSDECIDIEFQLKGSAGTQFIGVFGEGILHEKDRQTQLNYYSP